MNGAERGSTPIRRRWKNKTRSGIKRFFLNSQEIKVCRRTKSDRKTFYFNIIYLNSPRIEERELDALRGDYAEQMENRGRMNERISLSGWRCVWNAVMIDCRCLRWWRRCLFRTSVSVSASPSTQWLEKRALIWLTLLSRTACARNTQYSRFLRMVDNKVCMTVHLRLNSDLKEGKKLHVAIKLLLDNKQKPWVLKMGRNAPHVTINSWLTWTSRRL